MLHLMLNVTAVIKTDIQHSRAVLIKITAHTHHYDSRFFLVTTIITWRQKNNEFLYNIKLHLFQLLITNFVGNLMTLVS